MVSKSLSKKANITVSPVFTPLERLMNEVSEYLFIYLFIYLKKNPPFREWSSITGIEFLERVSQTNIRTKKLPQYVNLDSGS